MIGASMRPDLGLDVKLRMTGKMDLTLESSQYFRIFSVYLPRTSDIPWSDFR